MYDFPVELLVKQSLRSVIFDPASMGILSAKLQNLHIKTNTPVSSALTPDAAFYSLLRNPETVQHLFDKPRDNMHKIFECVRERNSFVTVYRNVSLFRLVTRKF